MKWPLLISFLIMNAASSAQVEIDGSIDLSNAPIGERHISGLEVPTTESSLSSLNSAVEGWAHWSAITSIEQDTITLQPRLEIGERQNGLLLRFIADTLNSGDTWIALPNSSPTQLIDKEGNELTRGRFSTREVLQIQWKDSVFILTNPPPSECPSGYLQLTETMCIQRSDNSSVDWFQANDACTKQGGSLCTFAEYIHACRSMGSELTGLFNNWEWIDDTSDHTHTADQVGRFSCHSNRSRGATHQDFANYRCCYSIR